MNNIKLFEEFEMPLNEMQIKQQLISFFTDNADITDDMVHALAEEMKVEHSKLEEYIYGLLTSFFYYGRYNDDISIKVNPEELDMGIKVEMEHTDCPAIAKRIALDHLAELDDYYTRLKVMEGDNH